MKELIFVNVLRPQTQFLIIKMTAAFAILLVLSFVNRVYAAINMLSEYNFSTGDIKLEVTMQPVQQGEPRVPIDKPSQGDFTDTITDVSNTVVMPYVIWDGFPLDYSIILNWQLIKSTQYPIRTIMTLICFHGDDQPTDVWFKLFEKSGNTEVTSKSTISKNMVIFLEQTKTLTTNIYLLVRVSPRISPSSLLPLNFDKIFAIREFSLNTYLFNSGFKSLNYDTVIMIASEIDKSNFKNSILDETFSENRNYCSIYDVSSKSNYIQQIVQDFTAAQQPLALVSSIFVQTGQYKTAKFSLSVSNFIFDSNKQKWFDSEILETLLEADGKNSGNFLFNLESYSFFNYEPVPVSMSQIYYLGDFSIKTKQQICAIQYFGWAHCELDDFQVVQPIKMTPEQKWIKIGRIIAYYDPDLKRLNNPFCQLGFQNSLQIYQDNQQTTGFQVISALDVKIDYITLDVSINTSILKSQTSQNSNGQYNIRFKIADDARKKLLPFSNSAEIIRDVQLSIGNYCNEAVLGYVDVTFGDNSIEKISGFGFQITYNYGMGIMQLYLKGSVSCEGYLKTSFEMVETKDLKIQTYQEFLSCTNKIGNNQLCITLDQHRGILYLYSDPNSASKSLSFQLRTNSQGYNTLDLLETVVGLINIFVNVQKSEKCQTTQLFVDENTTLPLKIKINKANETFRFKKSIYIKDSFSESSVNEKACGQRQFSIQAVKQQEFYEYAEKLLDCQAKSHICLTSSDNFSLTIDLVINNTFSDSMTVLFEVITELSFYSAQPLIFQIIIEFEPSIETSNLTEINVLNSVVVTNYQIGIINDPIRLQNYYQTNLPNQISWFEVQQTEGTIPANSYAINSGDKTLEIYVSQIEYSETTSVFEICAYLNAQISNCMLKIHVNFVLAQNALIHSKNTPPIFISPLVKPQPIPCFGLEEAKYWEYKFPKVRDQQNDTIHFQIECLDREIFQVNINQADISLQLNVEENDIEQQSLECKLQLSDDLGATSNYQLAFTSLCAELNNNYTAKLPLPIPTIRNISSSGLITITWNQNLKPIQQNNTRRSLVEKRSLDCFNSALDIQINRAKGSVFSSTRNLGFSQNVSLFEKNKTLIQLNFENTADISTESTSDQIEIRFSKRSCFTSVIGFQVNSSQVLKYQLPRQKTNGVFATPQLIETSVNMATNVSVFFFIMNFFLKGLLNNVLSSIEILGVQFHMFLVTLNYPVEMLDFFGVIFPLITFDALPLETFYERIFHFSEIATDEALTVQFDSSGYSSIFIVNNLGSLFLISILEIFLAFLLFLIRKFKPFRKVNWLLQEKLDSVADDSLWNGLISFYQSNYLVISVACFLESNNLRFGQEFTLTENFCSTLAVLGMCISVLYPFAVFLLYREMTKQIDLTTGKFSKIMECVKQTEEGSDRRLKLLIDLQNDDNLLAYLLQSENYQQFMATYGILIDGLRINRIGRHVAISTPIIDIITKLVIAVSVTRLVNHPVFTIFLFNFVVLFYTQFTLYFQPLQEKIDRLRASFNAVSLLVLNYHLFLFTRFTNQSMYPVVANSVIYLFWVCIGVNLLLTLPVQLFGYLLQLKRRYYEYKLHQRINKRNKILLKVASLKKQQLQMEKEKSQTKLKHRQDENHPTKNQSVIGKQSNLDVLQTISERSEQSSDSHQLFINNDSQIQAETERQIDQTNCNIIPDKGTKKTKKVTFQDQHMTQHEDAAEEQKPQNNNLELVLNSQLPRENSDVIENPLIIQFEDDSYPGEFLQTIPKYEAWQLLLGVKDNSVNIVDTRNVTVQKAIKKLEKMLNPIQWLQFELEGAPSVTLRRKIKDQQSQRVYPLQILKAKSILSKDTVTVFEHFADPQRRQFKFYLQGQFEASFYELKDRQNDGILIRKIEFLVKCLQLGLSPTTYLAAVSGEIDALLEWYANACKYLCYQDPYGHTQYLKTQNSLYSGEYTQSLTVVQKVALFQHVRNWIGKQHPDWQKQKQPTRLIPLD